MNKNYYDICSCFVLFNPEEDHHISAIDSVLQAGSRVVVYDNSDDFAIAQRNRQLLGERFDANVGYLGGDGNIGLSAAFNRLVEHVLAKHDVEALVLFDQDSTVTSELFTRLVDGYRRASFNHNVGVYAAYAVRVSGKEYGIRTMASVYTDSPGILSVKFAPSSFSLIPAESLRIVGLFQEDFFIDQIEVDFCSRCWSAGRVVLIDTTLRFPHRIGHGDLFLRGRPFMPISSPFRHYYQTRNIILSDRRNRRPFWITFRTVTVKIIKVTIVGLLADNFWTRVSFCLRGVADGLRGKGGRLV